VKCKLTGAQLRQLEMLLAAGPAASGWDEDQCWALARIAEVIRDRFKVGYTLAGVDLLLHRIGWSVQVPARRAAERDESARIETGRAWRRRQPTLRDHASAGLFSRSPRVVSPMPGLSRPRHRADCARVPPAAQCRAVGGDQAAPDTVLADIPVPQRQFQALGAYQAGGADRDRRGRLVAGLVCFRTDREPLVGIEGAVSAAGVPDDPGPQGLIGERDGRRRIRRPGSGPVHSVGGRPGIRRCGGARNSYVLAPSQTSSAVGYLEAGEALTPC
jgi:hypothetical protein